jgi:aspartate-semialdehyde dehydrogenase
MKVAIIGATGMVGTVMLQVLAERSFPVTELLLVASKNSLGQRIEWGGNEYSVIDLEQALKEKPAIAMFSAGGSVSKQWAPKFAEIGTTVIDNSSVWRMDEDKKLIVPEINAQNLTKEDKIIANPNCSTIQMVLALLPIHKYYGIERLIISTYQSVTGTGVDAVRQMENERNGIDGKMVYPHPIDQNCFPHGGDFLENGYTTEEMKLVHETRKILGDHRMRITATVVRIPVVGGHSEAVNVSMKKDYELSVLKRQLGDTPGVTLQDNTEMNEYPTPLYAQNKDDVFVGRIRRDESNPNSLDMWIVSDNLRKGAATNAVQIAEHIVKMGLI